MRGIAALLLALLALRGIAFADPPPARLAPDSHGGAEASFRAFASDWMTRVRAHGEHERANPRLTPGAREVIATYREVGPKFETELQATGQPSSPYVGVLRYTESVFTCSDLRATDCHVASTVPVTEVFRLRGEHWVF